MMMNGQQCSSSSGYEAIDSAESCSSAARGLLLEDKIAEHEDNRIYPGGCFFHKTGVKEHWLKFNQYRPTTPGGNGAVKAICIKKWSDSSLLEVDENSIEAAEKYEDHREGQQMAVKENEDQQEDQQMAMEEHEDQQEDQQMAMEEHEDQQEDQQMSVQEHENHQEDQQKVSTDVTGPRNSVQYRRMNGKNCESGWYMITSKDDCKSAYFSLFPSPSDDWEGEHSDNHENFRTDWVSPQGCSYPRDGVGNARDQMVTFNYLEQGSNSKDSISLCMKPNPR